MWLAPVVGAGWTWGWLAKNNEMHVVGRWDFELMKAKIDKDC
jgi:hypothetical protein